ncbi:hypothetical protein [Pseudoduganella violaceinigra]|uniref:hypothetical protein n=1 Tax=Pseudoduganella violaceinigra TaxID=246602 RepID=UPI0004193FE1|nr:hypothetical protein [Pseudoduganella violaceinigra]
MSRLFRSDEIELFINNYEPGDEQIIASALERIKADEHGMHALGMSVRHVCSENHDRRLAGVAEIIYRTNPCSLCRQHILEWMKELDCIPDWIVGESRCDASEETRTLVSE